MEQAILTKIHRSQRLLMREFSHRTNNELAGASSMLSRAAVRSNDQDARAALMAAADRLESYALVHRVLQMPEQERAVDACEHLRKLCHAICQSRLAERNVNLVLVESPLRLDALRCGLLSMVAYELIINCARHAFTDAGGDIRVELRTVRDFAELRVEDDGYSKQLTRGGHGLQLVNELVETLRGCFEQEFRSRGSSSYIIFPLTSRWPAAG